MAIKLLKSYKHILFLLVLGLLVASPFLRPGLPETDDGISMVIRASGFHQSFKDGHLPVRWIQRLNENYGYPVANFLYPLPFYLAEIPNLLGFSALNSVKMIFIFTTLLSGVGFYLWVKQLAHAKPALIASSLYLVCPYRFTILFERGSLGESTALAVTPFVFWQIEKSIRTQKLRHTILAAIFFGLLIPSHNSVALLLAPIIIGYFGLKNYLSRDSVQKTLFHLGIFTLLGFGLSAFFWIPALYDLQFTLAPSIQISNIQEHFYNPLDLSLILGFASLTIVWAAMGFLHRRLVHFWVIVFSIALFAQIPMTLPIWETLGLDRLIQFPIRFMAIAVISSSILAGHLFHFFDQLKTKKYSQIGIGIFILLCLISTPNIFGIKINQFDPGFFESNFDSSTNQREFTPRWVQVQPTTYATQPFQIETIDSNLKIVDQSTKANYQYLQVSTGSEFYLTFNTHYFPGWQPYVDDNPVEYQITDDGLIKIHVIPEGQKVKSITLRFQETPIRLTADIISLFSLLAIILFFAATAKHTKKFIGQISLIFLILNIFYPLLVKQNELLVKFNPVSAEQKYLNSQWVNPRSDTPIGDHGLYAWAGWAYLHGENPILINSEMPPLGKYLIGLGIFITHRPGIVGLFFSLTTLAGLYLLSRQIIQDKYLSLVPLTLFSYEKIFQGLLTVTMLDSIQLTFLIFAFYFGTKPKHKLKHLALSSLFIGGVITTKFYATGILVISAFIFYFLVSRQFKQLKLYLLTIPLTVLVHLLSYTQYFLLGNSLIDYLKVQKYIYHFYSQGGPRVPFGAYWLLVLFNRWRVWWGAEWGKYYTISSKEWNFLWPVNFIVALTSIFNFFKQVSNSWQNKSFQTKPYHLLTSWLLVYGTFLTFIGGWPHYLLLFLPFTYILLVKLVSDQHSIINSVLKITKSKLSYGKK